MEKAKKFSRAAVGELLAGALTLADQARSEFRSTTPLTGRAAQDHDVAAILNDRLSSAVPVSPAHLRNALESEHASTPELAESGERILQSINRAQRIELVYDEPQSVVALVQAHGFE